MHDRRSVPSRRLRPQMKSPNAQGSDLPGPARQKSPIQPPLLAVARQDRRRIGWIHAERDEPQPWSELPQSLHPVRHHRAERPATREDEGGDPRLSREGFVGNESPGGVFEAKNRDKPEISGRRRPCRGHIGARVPPGQASGKIRSQKRRARRADKAQGNPEDVAQRPEHSARTSATRPRERRGPSSRPWRRFGGKSPWTPRASP